MRLGKGKAAGYVEDTEVPEAAEVVIFDTELTERSGAAEQPAPAVVAG